VRQFLDPLEALEEARGLRARRVAGRLDTEDLVGRDAEGSGEIGEARSGRLASGLS
jgi:hypothetical protein